MLIPEKVNSAYRAIDWTEGSFTFSFVHLEFLTTVAASSRRQSHKQSPASPSPKPACRCRLTRTRGFRNIFPCSRKKGSCGWPRIYESFPPAPRAFHGYVCIFIVYVQDPPSKQKHHHRIASSEAAQVKKGCITPCSVTKQQLIPGKSQRDLISTKRSWAWGDQQATTLLNSFKEHCYTISQNKWYQVITQVLKPSVPLALPLHKTKCYQKHPFDLQIIA
jgi:hypothetical protein